MGQRWQVHFVWPTSHQTGPQNLRHLQVVCTASCTWTGRYTVTAGKSVWYTLIFMIKDSFLPNAASSPSLMAFSRLPAMSLYLKNKDTHTKQGRTKQSMCYQLGSCISSDMHMLMTWNNTMYIGNYGLSRQSWTVRVRIEKCGHKSLLCVCLWGPEEVDKQ